MDSVTMYVGLSESYEVKTMLLTTKEICELSGGLPVQTLLEWVGKEVVTPAARGVGGRGSSHRFNLMQALGIMVAAQLHQSERGASPSYVAKVVKGFEDMSEELLLAEFKQGWTHYAGPWPSSDGPLTLFRPFNVPT